MTLKTDQQPVAPLLSQHLSRPVRIKDRSVSPGIVLAPMAGLGHIAMRQLISEYGGFGLLFTGMCSARAVPHENRNSSLVFRWRNEELPFLVCQIFGSDPQSMAEAAQRIEQESFFGVDLNFGCSVAAICKKGSGAALLKNPSLCSRVVSAVRAAVDIPLFVKFRTGWENNAQYAVDMARRFEDAGADALTFHPRVAPDRRNRPPRWDIIKQVKQAVNIPVFGNGNLFTPEDGWKMIRQTRIDGLSVGRMAIARPWLFAQWSQGLTFDDNFYFKACNRYIDILSLHFDDYFALKFFKKFLPYFCANFKFGHQILKQMMRSTTIEEARDQLNLIFDTPPQTTERPNQHLFL
jgi:tRNA-dihydrouridine synthase B